MFWVFCWVVGFVSSESMESLDRMEMELVVESEE